MNEVVKPKKKPLQIYLTDEQKETLKAAANKQAVTMNAFIISKLSSVLK